MVLGMHRSGTSLVTKLLSLADFFVGEASALVRGDRWNRDGYFERWALCRLNERILNRCGGSWHDPPSERDIQDVALVSQFDSQIEWLLSVYKNRLRYVIKDPRMCLTLPVWQRVLAEEFRIVLITRHPYATAASLYKRDGFEGEKALRLWRIYNERAARYAASYPTLMLKYEDFFSCRRRRMLKELSVFLEIEDDLEGLAERCVDPRLQHHRVHAGAPCSNNAYDIDPRIEHELARRMMDMDRSEEAVVVLNRLVSSCPGHAIAHNDLGVLLYQNGDIRKASMHLEAARRLEPDNTTIKNNAAILDGEAKSANRIGKLTHTGTEFKHGGPAEGGPWWLYKRFRGDSVRVLLVSLKHLLLSEISGALDRLGHQYLVFLLEKEKTDRLWVERSFTQALAGFKPDFVLTVNHMGFDHQGVVTGLLSRFRIPFASWYVDSPYLIIRHHRENHSPYLTLFLWDKDYLEVVKRLGFENAEYLPLGVDETLFRPMLRESCSPRPASDVSFVGNSMVLKVRSRLSRCGIHGPLKNRFAEVSGEFERSHHLVVDGMLKDRFPDLAAELEKLTEPQALGYETAVIWQATGQYRLRNLEMLESYSPFIAGDPGWKEILGDGFDVRGELNYYSDLPAFYNLSRVSFNATSRQMKNGVNQRIFDVPACRRVLVTDRTRQLENLMEPGREILTYSSREEIPEKVGRVLKDRNLYDRICEAGYRRVVNAHTYRHRVARLVDVMKTNYG
jgi:spore maturation protein CgeB